MDFQIVPVAEASITTLMKSIDRVIINPIIFFLFAVAMAYFLYGLAQYLMSADNEEVRKKSKSQMIWGVVGLFIMVAVFGIMNIIINTLGVNNIKINSNGDYAINGGALPDKSVADSAKTGQNLFGPTQDISSDTNAPNLSLAELTTDPFPTYKQDALCWAQPIYAKAATEYDAVSLAKTNARNQYLKVNGISADDRTKANYPALFETKVLYDKNNKLYYAWVDARAPIGSGTMANCSLSVLTPAPTLPTGAVTSDNSLSTTTTKSTIENYNKSPFTTQYIPNAMCWHEDVLGTGSTEYKALQDVKAKSREIYVSATGLADGNVPLSEPKPYGVLTSYNKTDKLYYAWYDARGPVNGGTDSDCDLLEVPQEINQSNKPDPLLGTYVSDSHNWVVVDSGTDTTYIGARSRAISNALVQVATLKGLNSTTGLVYTILPEEKYYPQDPVTGLFDYWLAVESPK